MGGDPMIARGTSQNLVQLVDYMNRYQEKHTQNKAFYMTNRVIVLTLGASIPVLTTIDAPSWITALVGAAIVIVTGIGQIFAPYERYVAFRIGYKALDHERMLFLAGVGDYSVEGDTAETALAAKTAEIISSTEASVVSATKTPDAAGDTANK
jgi:hypothetical protein